VSLEKQEVEVRGSIGYDEVVNRVKKTGKKVDDFGASPRAWIDGVWIDNLRKDGGARGGREAGCAFAPETKS
jgi:hypothetical protein